MAGSLFRHSLDEHYLESTPDLLVADLNKRRFGRLTVRVVFLAQASCYTLVTPFPDQCPAIEQIFLEVEVVIARRRVPLWRNLHVDTHSACRQPGPYLAGLKVRSYSAMA
jgi:hypothetical protein